MSSFEDVLALPTPFQLFTETPLFQRPLWVKRDDLLHPIVSGNKFRKLKYPLQQIEESSARSGHKPCLVTMGGLWSNHVHATAYAAQTLGYSSHALIRGHEGMGSLMLDDCRKRGMRLQFVDRLHYSALRNDPDAKTKFLAGANNRYWLPEGGSDPAALRGVAELIDELPDIPDIILVACGTSATLAGLLAGLKGRSLVMGIAVLKNASYLRHEIPRLLSLAGYPQYDNYQLWLDFHHGGYAKVSPALLNFCEQFIHQTNMMIEPIYTGKVFFALKQLIDQGVISPAQSVMVLHTGGLQGRRGIKIPPKTNDSCAV